jgi:hypothetical protein
MGFPSAAKGSGKSHTMRRAASPAFALPQLTTLRTVGSAAGQSFPDTGMASRQARFLWVA